MLIQDSKSGQTFTKTSFLRTILNLIADWDSECEKDETFHIDMSLYAWKGKATITMNTFRKQKEKE